MFSGETITAGRVIEEIKYNELSKKVDSLITKTLLNKSFYGNKK